ncbi:MAG: S9 family peptidase [Chromatiaceae bacterium]
MSDRSTLQSCRRCAPLIVAGLLIALAGTACPANPGTHAQASLATPTAETSSAAPALIDRAVIFGNADRQAVRVSPDGSKIAYLAPREGVMNVWVAPVDEPWAAKPVTANRGRGIPWYQWAYTNEDILFGKDQGGNENWHIYRVNLKRGEQRDLTPYRGVNARTQELSPDHPQTMLAAINKRDKALHDVYRVDLTSGKTELVQENNGGFVSWVTDDALRVRLATRLGKSGEKTYLRPDGTGGWKPFIELSPEDAISTRIVGFDQSGKTLYLIDSRQRDKAALAAVDMQTGRRTVLFETERADVGEVLRHPATREPEAVSYTYERKRWKALDADFEARLEAAEQVHDGELDVVSRTLDDATWIIAFTQDDGPIRYYRFDARTKKAKFLFVQRKALQDQPLAAMRPVVIASGDGLDLVSYLTLPPWRTGDGKRPTEPVPLVVLVHGGPWSRVSWGYNPFHQWLANRGYAVLSVNFRGSTGFGKSFLNAGDNEWGQKMHQDVLDARQWAIDAGVTTADQVAIMGGSYGGYETLVGMTMSPDKFVAGVDIFGPSNLVTLFESIPPYWKPRLELMAARLGDPRTRDGRKLLEERSPLTYADRIRHPLLIGQGANDPRVKPAESEQIIAAMKGKGIPITYVLYPDEGHGFQRPENRMSFYAIVEQFLAKHLGGRAQPIENDFQGSSLRVPTGSGYFKAVVKELCKPHPARCEETKRQGSTREAPTNVPDPSSPATGGQQSAGRNLITAHRLPGLGVIEANDNAQSARL